MSFDKMQERYGDEPEQDDVEENRWQNWGISSSHTEKVWFVDDERVRPMEAEGQPGVDCWTVGELFDAVQHAANSYAGEVADHRRLRGEGYPPGTETLDDQTNRRIRAHDRLCRLIYLLEQV